MAIRKVGANMLREFMEKPLLALSNLISLVQALFAAIVAAFGLFGLVGGASVSSPFALPATTSLPFQLAILAILASGIGWALGFVVMALASRPTELRTGFAQLAAFCMSSVLLGVAVSLAEPLRRTAEDAESVFLLCGCVAAMAMIRMNFRTMPTGSRTSARVRAGAVCSFAATSLALALLSRLF